MNVSCEFKHTADVESFCQIGASQFVRNSHETHFVAVELYLWNAYFKHGARQLVGFPMNIVRTIGHDGYRRWTDRITNSDRILRKLSALFPEMGCRCSYRTKLTYAPWTRKAGFSAFELSCPHFGIRAIASEEMTER